MTTRSSRLPGGGATSRPHCPAARRNPGGGPARRPGSLVPRRWPAAVGCLRFVFLVCWSGKSLLPPRPRPLIARTPWPARSTYGLAAPALGSR